MRRVDAGTHLRQPCDGEHMQQYGRQGQRSVAHFRDTMTAVCATAVLLIWTDCNMDITHMACLDSRDEAAEGPKALAGPPSLLAVTCQGDSQQICMMYKIY